MSCNFDCNQGRFCTCNVHDDIVYTKAGYAPLYLAVLSVALVAACAALVIGWAWI